MPPYFWFGFLFLLLVIGAVIGVCIWSHRHQKHSPNNNLLGTNDDVQTGDLVALVVVTGDSTGSYATGFVPILSTTLTTPSDINRLYCTVSAFTSMATIDVNSPVTTGASSEMGGIDVQVLVDGLDALPGPITFNSVTHVVGAAMTPPDLLAFADDRGQSNSFTFVLRDILPGTHNVVVEARATAAATAAPATVASMIALVGDRSLVVTPGYVQRSCSYPDSSSSSSSSNLLL